MRPTTSYDDLVNSVLQKLGLQCVKRVKKIFYRISILVLQEIVKYDCFTIGSDEDLQVMFHCRRQFSEVRTPELLAKLVDVVSSSGGSNQNTQTIGTVAGSSSRPVGVSSSVPVNESPVKPVASPLFAVDLNCSGGREVRVGDIVPTSSQCAAPASLDNALLNDVDDDDVEPDIIADDSDDGIGASEPAGAGGGSSSSTQQDGQGSAGLSEFQVGQQFQNKDEVVLSVKTYSIRHGVHYKVVESDYRQYVGKCSKFGNGCTWLIRLSLWHRKGIREHQGASECDDSTLWVQAMYRRVWLAKQKAVAHIYGDWDESYNEFPRWVLGAQLTMPGTVAVLRTSPVRVGGQVDGSQAYFHRLFWTFPPCIEAFRYCKPLVSIDGTHLYGKYGGMLLVVIAQDGNSNILPVAFALVEGENAESWSFFLSHLQQHVTPQLGLLVISDRHNGVKAALEAPDRGWLPLAAYRAFYIRHVATNFALTFKGKDARRLLVNAAYAKTEVEFDYWFDILRSEDPAMCEWANRIEYSLWTQHRDEGRRFGHMTTNISECVNSILKGVRNLPVCSLVKATYGRLAELFVRKGREAEAQLETGQQFNQHMVKCIEAKTHWGR
ncbi:uncharacterized protein LOC130974695 [Arachis stenosperma]|uniref:uncharacterized protein LOC130974695 n=1 Tax=Arachis stenosperma TaxID=217475 RepID=UPI0025AC6F31|nr:uncharacterized protein LOC130974695 [Arachis stenosperma]